MDKFLFFFLFFYFQFFNFSFFHFIILKIDYFFEIIVILEDISNILKIKRKKKIKQNEK